MVRQVLLVEADPSARARQAGVLQILGHRVRAVARATASRRAPDVVIGGAAVCRALRLAPRTNPLALVCVGRPTGLTVEADAEVSARFAPSAVGPAIEQAVAAAEQRRAESALSDVRWRVPSDRDDLEAFCEQFRVWVEGCGLSPLAGQQIGLAVRELCANAMEWGHGFDRARPVSVAARLDDEKVSVLVRDGGPGFNPRHLPHAARPGDPLTHLSVRAAAQLREGGFGILMASGLADHLVYNEVGNEALVIKFLPTLAHRAPRLAARA